MEDKKMSKIARVMIQTIITAIFAAVWVGHYNRLTFDNYVVEGAIGATAVYFIIYNILCSVYKAFRIASCSIGEIIFSQMLAFGIADFILYVECCLIHNQYANILPGLAAAGVQILCTAVWAAAAKQYFMKHITPRKTLLVYGKNIEEQEINGFRDRILAKYHHLFDVEEMVREDVEISVLEEKLDACHTVLLYEVSHRRRARLGEYAIRFRKSLYVTPRLEDIVLYGCRPKHLLDTPLLKYGYAGRKQSECMAKRVLDVLFSLFFVVLLSPVLLITALAIKLEDHGPVLYRQDRCTKDGKVFSILKFRSMIVDAEKYGFIPCTSGDSRITRVGKIIRGTRIDELPQLLNILKGDMSFVGPRPERVEHVQKYTEEIPEFAYRMRVKGGLTGYAQIYGKYNTSAYDKLRLDLMYIENQSLLLDLKIVLLTLKIVFTPESTEGFSEEKSRSIAREEQNEQKAASPVRYAGAKGNVN